jgi:hypothetical protein
MLIIFTYQLITTIRILWFCHRSGSSLKEKKEASRGKAGFLLTKHVGSGVLVAVVKENPRFAVKGNLFLWKVLNSRVDTTRKGNKNRQFDKSAFL